MDLFNIFFVSIFTIVILAFVVVFKSTSKSDKKLAESMFYHERGGGTVGGGLLNWNASWPFATINLLEKSVHINVGGREVELEYTDIKDIKLIYVIPFLAEGIRIVHNNSKQPSFVRFWSMGKSKKLKSFLDEKINLSK